MWVYCHYPFHKTQKELLYFFTILMTTKNLVAVTLAYTCIAFATGTFAFDTNDFVPMEHEHRGHKPRGDMFTALQKNDYAAFQLAVANTPLAETINTEEKFTIFVQLHEALQKQDTATVEKLRTELWLPEKPMMQWKHKMWQWKRHNDAVFTAIEANDYAAFQLAVTGTQLATTITTQAKFTTFRNMHKAMQSGDIQTAEILRTELWIPGKEEMQTERKLLRTAIQNNDRATFQANAQYHPRGKAITTQEKFTTLVQLYQAIKNKDTETAKKLRAELGLPERPMMQWKKGMWQWNKSRGKHM